jgi:hypothetical protein
MYILPGDQEGLFKLVVQLRKFFNSVIYNTATGYLCFVGLFDKISDIGISLITTSHQQPEVTPVIIRCMLN